MANSSGERKAYRKPRIEKVSLVPDEAVLGGCKTSNGGGQGLPYGSGSSCELAGVPSACQVDGTS